MEYQQLKVKSYLQSIRLIIYMSDIMTYSHKYNRFLPRHTLLIGEHVHTHFQLQNNLQIKIALHLYKLIYVREKDKIDFLYTCLPIATVFF